MTRISAALFGLLGPINETGGPEGPPANFVPQGVAATRRSKPG